MMLKKLKISKICSIDWKYYWYIPNWDYYKDFIDKDNELVTKCELSSNFQEEYCKSFKFNMDTKIVDVEDNNDEVK